MPKNFSSLLISGWTGTGKTYLLTKLLTQIVNDEQDMSKIILINPKNEKFPTILKSDKVISNIKTLNQMPEFAKVVHEHLLPRLINYFSNKETPNTPHLYLFIDEYLDFMYKEYDFSNDLLALLLKYQEALNTTFIIATQRTDVPAYLTRYTKTHITLFYPEVYLGAPLVKKNGYLDFKNTLVTGNERKVNAFLEKLNEAINYDLTSFHLPIHFEAFKKFIKNRQSTAPENLREHYLLLRISENIKETRAINALFNLSHELKLTYVIKKTGQKTVPYYLHDSLHTHLHFK